MKTLGLKEFLSCQVDILMNLPSLFGEMWAGRINKAFREKMMLAVTAVNGCRICSWYHAKEALKSGVGKEEIDGILGMVPGVKADGYETVGILYAIHFAESDRKPERIMTERLYRTYGRDGADDILSILRLVYFGNLMGNTLSTIIRRLSGYIRMH